MFNNFSSLISNTFIHLPFKPLEIVLFTIFGFILGACLGSFAKVLADRSLSNHSFMGRSECTFCKHKLAILDLIPFFSYIFLRGKCRYCHKKFSREYFLTELVLGLLVAFVFYQAQISSFDLADPWRLVVQIHSLIFNTFVVVVLTVVFITDWKKTIIPNRITYPAIIISLASGIILTLYEMYWLYFSLAHSKLGNYLMSPHSDYFQRHLYYTAEPFIGSLIMGVAIGLFFLALILVTRGRGMGGGDLKLGIFMGLSLGFPNALLALMLSFLLGSAVGLGLMLAKKKHFGQTIPFGPFLSLGGLIALFWGQQIIDWYLKLKV
jgi:leader peptidase (prepilin peptidase) / N-methyltransferase